MRDDYFIDIEKIVERLDSIKGNKVKQNTYSCRHISCAGWLPCECIRSPPTAGHHSLSSLCPASLFFFFVFSFSLSLTHFLFTFHWESFHYSLFLLTFFPANLDIPAIFCSVFASVESLTAAGLTLHRQQLTVRLFFFSPPFFPSSLFVYCL